MTTETIILRVDEKGARVVSRNINEIGVASQNTDKKVSKLAGTLKTALGAFVGFAAARQSVNTLREFSQEMSTVQAITRATGDSFQALRAEAIRLGSETRFSATQAAEGMAFLARAGFDTEQVLASINDTLLLAQAGALDLGSAADIASNVLTAFNLNAEETGHVVDVLAFQANKSNTDVRQLGEAMKFAAPVAANLGVNVEATSAAIGALSDAGIQGSLAGTGLRQALLSLVKPTEAGRVALEGMGLSIADVDVTSRGLLPVLKTLRDANLDIVASAEIAGKIGAPALNILAQSFDKVAKNAASTEVIEDFAKTVAEVMDDNLNGAVLRTISAFETLTISLGDVGAESALTAFFNSLAKTLLFVAENVSETIRGLGVLAVALASYKIAVAVAAAETTIFSGAMKLLNAVILANPIAKIASLTIGAVTAIALFSDKISLTSDGLVSLKDFGVEAFSRVSDAVKSLFESFSDNKIIDSLGDSFANFASIATKTFSSIASFSIKAFKSIVTSSAAGMDLLIGFFVGYKNVAVFVYETISEKVKGFFDSSNEMSADNAKDSIINFESISTAAVQAYDFITEAALNAYNATKLVAGETIDATIETGESEGASFGEQLASEFLQGFETQLATDAVNAIADGTVIIIDSLKSEAKDIVDTVRAEKEKLNKEAGGLGVNQDPLFVAANDELAGPPVDTAKIIALKQVTELINEEREALEGTNRQREIAVQLKSLLDDLDERKITHNQTDRESIKLQLEQLQNHRDLVGLSDELSSKRDDLNLRVALLSQLLEEGSGNAEQLGRELEKAKEELVSLSIENGDAGFFESFRAGLEEFSNEAENVAITVGGFFAEMTGSLSTGIGKATGDALVFGKSFKDSVGNVARNAVSSLIGSIVELGIKMAINAALGRTTQAASTAATVVEMGVISASAAPAAALTSTATGGGAAIAGSAALAAILALAAGAAVSKFADGGFVSGSGGPRSDSIPALLSNGEFVMNAESTRKYRPLLEQFNSGKPARFAQGGLVGPTPQVVNVSSNDSQTDKEPNFELTNVNFIDPDLFDGYMNTRQGKKTMMNFISSNSSAVNTMLG